MCSVLGGIIEQVTLDKVLWGNESFNDLQDCVYEYIALYALDQRGHVPVLIDKEGARSSLYSMRIKTRTYSHLTIKKL